MSDLPRRLSPGTTLTANWLNRLLDFLRSRDLTAGPGIRLSRTPSGTTVSAAPEAERPEEPIHWKVRDSADGSATGTIIYCNNVSGRFPVQINGQPIPIVRSYPFSNGWMKIGVDTADEVWLDWAVSDSEYQRNGLRAFADVAELYFAFRCEGETLPTGYTYYSDVNNAVDHPWLPIICLAVRVNSRWQQRHFGEVVLASLEADTYYGNQKNSFGTVAHSLDYAPGSSTILQLRNFGNVSGGAGDSVLVRVEDVHADDPTYALDYISGATGSFRTADGKTVTVRKGVITDISGS